MIFVNEFEKIILRLLITQIDEKCLSVLNTKTIRNFPNEFKNQVLFHGKNIF